MGDFNIAQFIGGIVEGMGKGLTSDKGGGAMSMEVIPKKKNAPPVIELTPSQHAAGEIVNGAGEAAAAVDRPMLSPLPPTDGPRNFDPVDEARIQTKILNYQPKQLSPADQDAATRQRLLMRQRQIEESRKADQLLQDQGVVTRGGGMRQMRSGGITEPGEEVIVHENEKVQGLPNGQVIVTPEEEVAVERGMPQVGRSAGEHTSPALPPNMAIPDTVQQGPNDEEYIQNQLYKDMEVKSSPWKDLGAALIQAGNNHFNNKNEPIRTWGEIQRDKRVAPLAAKLALVRDAKKARMDAETNAARLGLINQQAKTIPIDDELKALDIERKRTADDRKYEIQTRTQTWKEADRAEYWKQEEIKQEAIRRKDTATVRLAEARQKELERHNLVTERQGDKRLEQGDQRIEGARLSREDLNKYRGASLQLRQAGQVAGLTPAKQKDIAARKQKLKESLITKVRAGKITQADMDDILSEEVDAGFGAASGEVDK